MTPARNMNLLFRPTREELWRPKGVFDNYKLSFIELRGIEVAEVGQIFERINQAGQPLSMFGIAVPAAEQGDAADGAALRN